MKPVLIKNGLVYDGIRDELSERDILIEADSIKAIEPAGGFSSLSGVEVVDATDCIVAPGLVDLHVHLREPGFEWKETIARGSEAALLGGYTSICCMPNTKPAIDNAEITKFILQRAAQAAAARVYPIGAVSLQRLGKQMAPFSELRAAGCVAFSDDGDPVYDAGLMRRALEWARMLDAPIACHEEDKSLSCDGAMNESALSAELGLRPWPKVAEEVMIARDIELARTTKAAVHICHVSSARGVELVRRAKNDHIRITAEVTPHHLVLTEESVRGYETNAKMSPPLREAEDVEALQAGINDGTIDAVASDHAPHELDSKQCEFGRATMGIIGVQTSLPLMLELISSGAVRRVEMLRAMTAGPAKAFRLPAGTLSVSGVADIVVLNPKKRWTFSKAAVHSLSSNSPFIGRQFTGAVSQVFVGGRCRVKDDQLIANDQ